MGATDWEPIYSAAELRDLCRSGEERIAAALDEGPAAAKETYRQNEGAMRGFCELYNEWLVLNAEYLREHHGSEARVAGSRPERTAEMAVRSGMGLADLELALALLPGPDNPQTSAFEAAVDAGDTAAATAVWRRTESAFRFVHDLRRDLVADDLGRIYRLYGMEGLTAVQGYAAERGWWVRSMPADFALDPARRLAELAFFLTVSCFCKFEIEELEDRWVVQALTCGNCGRQLEDRYRSDEDWGLEVVREKGPATFGMDAVTVYQSHLALIHHVFAIKLVGAPWPAFRCAGLDAGSRPCEWNVFKDPATTDREFFEMVGA